MPQTAGREGYNNRTHIFRVRRNVFCLPILRTDMSYWLIYSDSWSVIRFEWETICMQNIGIHRAQYTRA